MLAGQLLEVLQQQTQLIATSKDIWVAYSGGIDSHVLLHLTQQYIPNVRAIHINHALHITHDAVMQQHCQQVCTQLNIPLQCVTVAAKPTSGQSPEAVARNARRQAWQQVLPCNAVLLLAHHATDQAETILYRLLRGAGPHGLAGMRQSSMLGSLTILRPFLTCTKQAILAYAQQHNLRWCEDRTNQDLAFDRNYLRTQILPLLQQRWPAALHNINRAGAVCRQVVQLNEPLITAKLAALMDERQALDLLAFNAESAIWQRELLRAWLQQHALTPSIKQLQIILQEVIAARVDAKPQLAIGTKCIKRYQHKLYITAVSVKQVAAYIVTWDLPRDLLLPTGQLLTSAQIFPDSVFIEKLAAYTVTVRQGVLGRKAKKFLQQYAIPPWERTNYPLVYADERLVSIVGLWCTQRL